MKLPFLADKSDTLLALYGLSFVIFGWFAFALSLSDLFLTPLLIIGAILVFAISLLFLYRFFMVTTFDFRVVFALVLLYAVLLGFTTEPTIFSGRDQGSISEAAWRLAQNGQLAFSHPAGESFFNLYGEGAALHFPGFAYTSDGGLITQFPLPYTAWLGSFTAFFGLSGFAIANALLLFLFLLTFYALIRLFAHPFYAGFGTLLAALSFLLVWFSKVTLTENLALFLFTLLAYNLVLFLREGKFIFYAGALLSAGLLAFTRIEGFAFLALTLGFFLFRSEARAIWKMYPWKSIVIPGVIFIFIFLRDFFINLPYYKVIGKALIKFGHQFGSQAGTSDIAMTSASFSFGSVFFLYGLLVVFAIGLFGLLVFVRERKWILFLPAFLALPTFVYLFDPNISLDHPWMLRRYLFSLFPTLLFSATLGIALLFAKVRELPIEKPAGKRLVFTTLIFLSLLFLQYPAWSSALLYAENKSLHSQVKRFSEEFSDKDLILVDRFATGSGFAMLSGPTQFLHGKNTVYFFNPSDLKNLDTSRYEKVYLLVPEEGQSRYVSVFGDRLTFKKSVTFTLEHFENLSLEEGSSLHFPRQTVTETRNSLFQIF